MIIGGLITLSIISVSTIFFFNWTDLKTLTSFIYIWKKQIQPLEQWAVAVTDYSKQLKMTLIVSSAITNAHQKPTRFTKAMPLPIQIQVDQL